MQNDLMLQQQLRQLGYDISADGVFGKQSKAALRHFQSTHGLKADGVAGAQTEAMLAKAVEDKVAGKFNDPTGWEGSSALIDDGSKSFVGKVFGSILAEWHGWGAEKNYSVYTNPLGVAEAVKHGWSWPAFFFLSIWAITKRLWVHALVLVPVQLVIASFYPSTAYFFMLVPQLVVASRANDWRRKNLQDRGFVFAANVQAHTPEGAISEFAKQKPALATNSSEKSTDDLKSRLAIVDDLLERKMITPDEYQLKRKAIIDSI